jgi:hypothetical protein
MAANNNEWSAMGNLKLHHKVGPISIERDLIFPWEISVHRAILAEMASVHLLSIDTHLQQNGSAHDSFSAPTHWCDCQAYGQAQSLETSDS